jgi:hypothetical protein
MKLYITRTTLHLTLALAQSVASQAQIQSLTLQKNSVFQDFADIESTQNDGPETVIWSESFSNGIPTGWSTSGTANGSANANAIWEYRGPNTTPSNTTGSRGGYATGQWGQLPILSPTASNGYVIFDSDYLDNNGIANNFCGTGALACAPHHSTLTTTIINLQQHSNVELNFYQYYRRFAGPGGVLTLPATYVDISTNGGVTWPNTISINSNVAINSATARNSFVSINISQFIGNQSNVKLRFRFDGEYYFWQIDDLEIVSVPKFRLTKEQIVATNKVDGKSSSFRFSNSNECNGVVNLRQVSPLIFDGNVKNTGTNVLPNLKLQVKVFRNNQVDTILYSTTQPSLSSNSTASFSINSGYTPTDTGIYALQYSVISDSTSTKLDSLWFQLTKNQIGSHLNMNSNSIGTSFNASWGSGSWVSQVFNLSPDTLVGIRIPLLVTTVASSIDIQIGNNTAVTHTITTTDVSNGFIYVPFSTHYPVSGSTPIKLTLNGTVNLKNDATVSMEIGRRQMYLAISGGPYSGYNNSDAFNRIHFNLFSKPTYVPNIAYTSDTLVVCAGDTVNLIGSPGYLNYLWNNGATTQNLAVTSSGTYYLIVTSSNGTTDTSDYFLITVKNRPLLSYTSSGPLEFCDGGSVTINVSGAPNLFWSNGSNQNSLTLSSSTSIFVYGIDIDNYCLSDTLYFTITEFSNPSINISSNISNNNLCPGSTALLQASGANSYLWSTNDTTNTISVNSSGWYSVSGTDSNGCVATDSLFIGMNPAVVGTQIFGSSIVQPNSAQVYATQQNPGNTYVWTVSGGALISGQNSNTISVLWGTSGIGVITLEEGNGLCIKRDTMQVSISGIGLNEPNSVKLTVHPNPTVGMVSLNLTLIGTYELYSNDGRMLESGTAKKDYDLTRYPKGVYNLRLLTDEGSRVLKIVKN